MSVAYLILAHRSPRQLVRLVDRLHHPDDQVFVHIDRKTSLKPFADGLEGHMHAGHVRLARRRVRSSWGSFDLVAATLGLLEQALQEAVFTHVTLLSGEDYPLVPSVAFRHFLVEAGERSFMFHSGPAGAHAPDRSGNEQWYWNGDLRRLTYRHYRVFGRQWAIPNRYMPLPLRHGPPHDLNLYQGSQWWTLSREAAQYVVEAFVRRPELSRFFRRVQAPDEYAIQMVLANSPLRRSIVNDDLHFIEWENWHARTLIQRDLPRLRATTKPFARKFDETVNPELLAALDELISERERDPEATIATLRAKYLGERSGPEEDRSRRIN